MNQRKKNKLHEFFMDTAIGLSQQSNCVSKQVGAVIVKDDRIISIGYNGSPSGFTNCSDVFDKNDFNRNEHHEWSNIYEIHAEMNAVLYAAKNGIAIDDCEMYVTLKPCDQCLKNLIHSGITTIYYLNEYDMVCEDNDLYRFIKNKINVIKFEK